MPVDCLLASPWPQRCSDEGHLERSWWNDIVMLGQQSGAGADSMNGSYLLLHEVSFYGRHHGRLRYMVGRGKEFIRFW